MFPLENVSDQIDSVFLASQFYFSYRHLDKFQNNRHNFDTPSATGELIIGNFTFNFVK